MSAEVGEDMLVVKNGEFFMCFAPDGDVTPDPITREGLYAYDTRFLSEFC